MTPPLSPDFLSGTLAPHLLIILIKPRIFNGVTSMQQIDLRGSMVPFTLLKISNTFRTLKKGERLEILLSDSDALNDLVRIIPESSYSLLLQEDLEEEDLGIRIQLKKLRGNDKRAVSLPTHN